MKVKVIACIYPNSNLIPFLTKKEWVTTINPFKPITLDFIEKTNPNFIICHGHNHIIKPEVIRYCKLFDIKIINHHCSYLPWNRGMHPNVWSWVDNTPKGCSIMEIDESIDGGGILVQKEIKFDFIKYQTLATTYNIIRNEIEDLFMENWEHIKYGRFKSQPQPEGGSFHWGNDLNKLNLPIKLCGRDYGEIDWDNIKVKDLSK